MAASYFLNKNKFYLCMYQKFVKANVDFLAYFKLLWHFKEYLFPASV